MNFDTERTTTNAGGNRKVSPKRRRTAASVMGLLSFIALTGMTAQRALCQATCTLATVQGSYGLVGSGTYLGEPVTVTGVFTTNGAGNFGYQATQNINGTVSSFSITGRYTLIANCTATVRLINGETFSAVVVSGGSEIDFQSTTPGSVETVVAKKLSSTASSTCSLATVTGSYGLVGSGTYFGEPATVTGIVTTNGAGNFVYGAIQNVNGTVSSFTITGTYTLNANCSATITFVNGETFSAVVVSDGSEIDFQSTTPDLFQTVVAKKTS
jgi:hypothetical protein